MSDCRTVVFLIALLAPLTAHARQKPNAPPPPLKEAPLKTWGACTSVAFGPNDRYLAAGGEGGIRLLKLSASKKNGQSVPLLPQRGWVDQVVVAPSRNILISKNARNEVRVWNAETLKPVRIKLEDQTLMGFAYSLARSAKGGSKKKKTPPCTVLSNRKSGVRLWMPQQAGAGGMVVHELYLREQSGVRYGRVTAAAAGSSVVLLGNENGVLYKFAEDEDLGNDRYENFALFGPLVSNGPPPPSIRAHRSRITSVSLSSDGSRCVTAGRDGYIRSWKVEALSEKSKAEWEIAGELACLSPDGRFLAIATDKGVGVHHAASGIALSWNPLDVKSGRVVALEFNGAGTVLAGILCRCRECVVPGALARSGAMHGGQVVIWQ